jgi:hypothetical protein
MDEGFKEMDHPTALMGRNVYEQTGRFLTQLVRASFRIKREQFIELHP